jgi:acetyl-CoA carboxylase carboxyl transferase subunit alpha
MILEHEQPIAALEDQLASLLARGEREAAELAARELQALRGQIFSNLSPLQRLQICRHIGRPHPTCLLRQIGQELEELHGDRLCGDDPALVASLATIGSHRVMVLASQKGRGVEERIRNRFGMMNPEGFRKARRMLELAERFGLPVVCLVDTAGAYPGMAAEERGQGWAIAETIATLTRLRTPVLSVITGEGCSGGALALAVADWLALFEHAYFSVISPEGCSSILWKDRSAIGEAASALKMQAEALREFNLIDAVLPEGPGGAHLHPQKMGETLKTAIIKQLDHLKTLELSALLDRRQARIRSLKLAPLE